MTDSGGDKRGERMPQVLDVIRVSSDGLGRTFATLPAAMSIPPWQMGDVLRKIMLARTPPLDGSTLAKLAQKRRSTISNLLRNGRYDLDTIEAVCRVLGVDQVAIQEEIRNSNAWRTGAQVIPMPTTEGAPKRRASDREPDQIDADQYARRILRLPNSAQVAIYNAIRAFEEILGLFGRRNNNR